ncbi:hypothetical protein GQ44DRAFT_712184 [Phaeosphaeriaceae sp. PMI808]|nr:hypothetical protein GQ44DRAFT_712184 [Phaeosphaeriaceae sp. PMI808]
MPHHPCNRTSPSKPFRIALSCACYTPDETCSPYHFLSRCNLPSPQHHHLHHDPASRIKDAVISPERTVDALGRVMCNR